jgi:hypothetical protein
MFKNSIALKTLKILLIAIFLVSGSNVDARVNASLVEFVAGTQEQMSLFILDDDIAVDLGNESPNLRMMMDVEPLLVQKAFPQSFKIKTYSFDINGEKVVRSTMNHTIRRRNRSMVRFTVDLGYIEGDQDLFFEFYDSADRLVNTYRQTIDFSNLQEQVVDTTPIEAADCDNNTFNECHLDYIVDKLNFLLEPKNTNYSNKIKNPNGSYSVVLSIPKSVQDQILSGNVNITSAGLGLLGGTDGDNLGNHMATEDLQMKGFSVTRASGIFSENIYVTNGSYLNDLYVNGTLTIPHGAANGYVLMSDAKGNASWQSLSVAMNGDNLGNHIATKNLQMQGFNVDNVNLLTTESIVANGAFAFKSGAVDGYVLTSDASGNGHWRPVSTVVDGDGMGNHRADLDLNMNGHSIIAVNEVNANILRANVIDVTTVDVGAQIHSPTLHGDIDIDGTLTIPLGAGPGKVLMSDMNGNATWQNLASGGAFDNLGNHTATQDLDLNGNGLIDVGQVIADRVSTKNVQYDTLITYVNGASLDIDWSLMDKQVVEVNQDTVIDFTNDPEGTVELSLVVRQDVYGSHNVTFATNSNIKWSGGSSPNLTGNGSSLEIIDCYFYSSENDYLCNRRSNTYF